MLFCDNATISLSEQDSGVLVYIEMELAEKCRDEGLSNDSYMRKKRFYHKTLK